MRLWRSGDSIRNHGRFFDGSRSGDLAPSRKTDLMCAGKMHDDEMNINVALVRRLVAAQFPQWANLPVKPVEMDGTVLHSGSVKI